MSGTSPIMVLLGWAMRWQCWAGRVACGTLVARGPGDEHGRSRDAVETPKKSALLVPTSQLPWRRFSSEFPFLVVLPALLLIANKADNVYKAVK